MRKPIFLIVYMLIAATVCQAAPKQLRQRLTFDQGWQFRLCKNHQEVKAVLDSLGVKNVSFGTEGEKAAKTKVTDDTEPEQAQVTAAEVTASTMKGNTSGEGFQSVCVPHDWSSFLPFDPQMGGSAGYLAGGQGVYVKDFKLPSSVADKERIDIAFDGVYHRATVWLNGHRLGHHMYGYTGFSFNLTPYLYIKGNNRLVVHVDREEQSRWYTGSGIYRHVWIEATAATRVKENGVFVVAKTDGTIIVKTELEGDKEAKVTHAVFGPDGKQIASSASEELKINNPQLWSCDTPVMYRLVTKVKNSRGRLTDEVTTPFGFRSIRFDANTGFWLNEKNLKLSLQVFDLLSLFR